MKRISILSATAALMVVGPHFAVMAATSHSDSPMKCVSFYGGQGGTVSLNVPRLERNSAMGRSQSTKTEVRCRPNAFFGSANNGGTGIGINGTGK